MEYGLIQGLISQKDEVDRQYVSGEIDREMWSKSLESINDKLTVLGLQLHPQPWVMRVNGKPDYGTPPF